MGTALLIVGSIAIATFVLVNNQFKAWQKILTVLFIGVLLVCEITFKSVDTSISDQAIYALTQITFVIVACRMILDN